YARICVRKPVTKHARVLLEQIDLSKSNKLLVRSIGTTERSSRETFASCEDSERRTNWPNFSEARWFPTRIRDSIGGTDLEIELVVVLSIVLDARMVQMHGSAGRRIKLLAGQKPTTSGVLRMGND
ncbi:hypothetical protein U1Q18_050145, partial [Sarracenia purpurea var. burkii]